MKRRSRLWLLAALVLFGVAAWLMRAKTPARAHIEHKDDDFPHYLRPKESERLRRRQVVLPPRADASPRALPRERDPFLAALPPVGHGVGGTAVVFEADAIKGMPVGQMFLR